MTIAIRITDCAAEIEADDAVVPDFVDEDLRSPLPARLGLRCG
jgi:hypothetical protein